MAAERLQKTAAGWLLVWVLCRSPTANTNANYLTNKTGISGEMKSHKFRIAASLGRDSTVVDRDEEISGENGVTVRKNWVMYATPQGMTTN